MGNDFTKTLADSSVLKIQDNSELKNLTLNPNNGVKPGGISNLGKAGIGLVANVAGELGNKFISDGFNTVPGTLISNIGSAAGSVISMIPGVANYLAVYIIEHLVQNTETTGQPHTPIG